MGDYVLLKNETLVATNANGEVMLGDYIQPSPSPSVTPSISFSTSPSQTPSITPSISLSRTPSISLSRTPSITPSRTPSITPSQLPVTLTLRYIGSDAYNANTYRVNNLTYTWTDGSLTEPSFTWKGASNRTEKTTSFNLKNMLGSTISRDIRIETFGQAAYLDSVVVQIYINSNLYDTKSTTGMHDALTTSYESDSVNVGDIPVNPGDTLEIKWTDTIE